MNKCPEVGAASHIMEIDGVFVLYRKEGTFTDFKAALAQADRGTCTGRRSSQSDEAKRPPFSARPLSVGPVEQCLRIAGRVDEVRRAKRLVEDGGWHASNLYYLLEDEEVALVKQLDTIALELERGPAESR